MHCNHMLRRGDANLMQRCHPVALSHTSRPAPRLLSLSSPRAAGFSAPPSGRPGVLQIYSGTGALNDKEKKLAPPPNLTVSETRVSHGPMDIVLSAWPHAVRTGGRTAPRLMRALSGFQLTLCSSLNKLSFAMLCVLDLWMGGLGEASGHPALLAAFDPNAIFQDSQGAGPSRALGDLLRLR